MDMGPSPQPSQAGGGRKGVLDGNDRLALGAARSLEDSVRVKKVSTTLSWASRATEADSFMPDRRPALAFATPRKLPKARDLAGRVVVLDVAFASEASGGGFEKITLPFLEGLGPRLAAWVDHHDHALHEKYSADSRFVLATKAEHGACPEMVTKDLVRRVGQVDTIVCHTDFDGLCSAAKWIRGGEEPYPGADDDARAVDTRLGVPSPTAQRIDRAIRAHPRDHALFGIIIRHLTEGLRDPALWTNIDSAGKELAPHETVARALAREYRVLEVHPGPAIVALAGIGTVHAVAVVDATLQHGRYDKTLLLLAGQERAGIAILLDRDTMTLAARFDSGINLLALLDLSGGMPTLVSVQRARLGEVLLKLGADPSDVDSVNRERSNQVVR